MQAVQNGAVPAIKLSDSIPTRGVLPPLKTQAQYNAAFASSDAYFQLRKDNPEIKRENLKREITTIILVRHGQSEANKAGYNAGRRQSPLTEEGKLQSQAVGKYLKDSPIQFQAVYVTPIKRTGQTYDEINAVMEKSLPPAREEEYFIERSGGSLEGMAKEPYSKYKKDETEFLAEPHTFEEVFNYKMKDEEAYESLAIVWKRVVPAFRKLAKEHPGEDILAVGHVGVQRALSVGAAACLDQPAFLDWRSIEIPNGAVMIFESDGGDVWLKATSKMDFVFDKALAKAAKK